MIKAYLKNMGYKENEIEKLLNDRVLGELTEPVLKEHIEENTMFLSEIGLSLKEIIKISKKEPCLFIYNRTTLANKIHSLSQLGFNHDEIIKMIKLYPTILVLGTNKIIERIAFWMSLGYSEKEVLKLLRSFPALLGITQHYILARIDDLKELGYSEEDIKKMSMALPQIYSLSILNIKKRLVELLEYGISTDVSIKMTSAFPNIFGYNSSTFGQKIACYKELKIMDYICQNPMKIIQSPALIMARKRYLETLNIDYIKRPDLLFLNSDVFEKRFGISKEALLGQSTNISGEEPWNI